MADISPPTRSASSLQIREVYRAFSGLVSMAEEHFGGDLGGKLLLCAGLDSATLAIASSIAGAVSLAIDPDEACLKDGIRNGIYDFMVNSLDEALRILKNEIRKKQPVSVALQTDVEPAIQEMAARGVQPDLIAGLDSQLPIHLLFERGALSVQQFPARGSGRIPVSWSAKSSPALWLPKVDALAAEALSDPEDPRARHDPRTRWLKLAPRYLGRPMTGSRYLEMTPSETERFASLIEMSISNGTIGTEITVTRD